MAAVAARTAICRLDSVPQDVRFSARAISGRWRSSPWPVADFNYPRVSLPGCHASHSAYLRPHRGHHEK